ncbi:MAG: nitroreductase family protein [Oscillospiraceae bacterium]|nr:nitroreductase family protein [Oscillospiraceae bacterium]
MDHFELMRARHSVRRFTNVPLQEAAVAALREELALCNRESGLHLQLVTDEPEAFSAEKPHYGVIHGCRNYLALVGEKDRDEAIGYYGERLVLTAQALGVSSCWVALTYKKSKARFDLAPEEKLYMVIALGYGETAGTPHRSKPLSAVSDLTDDAPDWYRRGLEAALLAPTAVNQQKFRFTRNGSLVRAKAGLAPCAKVDLGIVKYHFELGAGRENFRWA